MHSPRPSALTEGTYRHARRRVGLGTWLERALLLVAVVCFGTVGWVEAEQWIAEREGHEALAEIREARHASLASDSSVSSKALHGGFEPESASDALSSNAVPSPWGTVARGDLVGRLVVTRSGAASPSLDRAVVDRAIVDAIVLAGSDEDTLRRAVGHLDGTPLPGEPGTVALAGHRDAAFGGLKHTERGDEINFETPHGTFRYTVEATRVIDPDDMSVLDSRPGVDLLTLVTCYPFDFVGPAPQRFVVTARRVGGGS